MTLTPPSRPLRAIRSGKSKQSLPGLRMPRSLTIAVPNGVSFSPVSTGMGVSGASGRKTPQGEDAPVAPDAGLDIAPDAGFDIAPDAGFDIAPDAGFDIAPDAGLGVAPDAGFEAASHADHRGGGAGCRTCHDCGCATYNYRCDACLTAWRNAHGVLEEDLWSEAAYGAIPF